MRHTLILYLAGVVIFYPTAVRAQQHYQLKIEEAVVFLSSAELTSTAQVNLAKGENELLFTNVASNINKQSINVGASNGVVVEGASFLNNYLGEEVVPARVKEIKDSINQIAAAKGLSADKLTVLAEQIAVLNSNRKVSGERTGLNTAELTKMLDLLDARLEGYLNRKGRQEELLRKANEQLDKLNSQLYEEQKKGLHPIGQILVKFYAPEAIATKVMIDYVAAQAGWTPAYDIMADAVNMPIKLAYKANIFQSTGVDWNKVKLSLSTGNPNEGVNAPVLPAWYLAFYRPPVALNQNRVLSNAEIATIPTSQVTDVVSTTYGVYQSQRGADVSLGGGRSTGTRYIIDGVQVQGSTGVDMAQGNTASIDNYVTVDNAGVNTTFDIDLPYTIPCDGKEHMVAVKKYELPATYRYYAAPKLDQDAFLQAQITNWEDLNLLPGQTNIFYEGTYVGQGMLDAHNVKDTMAISLGRDKKIMVKRERDTKRTSSKSIGYNVRETFAYSITVRNTRKESVNLTILDQMPVSNDKSIVLEDMDYGDSDSNEKTGIMKWYVAIGPNETKKLGFGFTVKYPKGKVVANLR